MVEKVRLQKINDPIKVLKNAFFPCPVCDEILEVRISKVDKPYMVCDPCGVQLFVRTKTGILKLLQRCT